MSCQEKRRKLGTQKGTAEEGGRSSLARFLRPCSLTQPKHTLKATWTLLGLPSSPRERKSSHLNRCGAAEEAAEWGSLPAGLSSGQIECCPLELCLYQHTTTCQHQGPGPGPSRSSLFLGLFPQVPGRETVGTNTEIPKVSRDYLSVSHKQTTGPRLQS